jgi:flagellar motor switch protein FliG
MEQVDFGRPSEDQIRIHAMNGGCTEEGSKVVAEIASEYPELDLQEVIKEVAGGKSGDKDQIVGKMFKSAESNKGVNKAEQEAMKEAAKKNNAPLPATKAYNNTSGK